MREGPILGPWEASRFRRRVRANLQHNFSRLVLGAQGPRPYNGRDVTQVDTSRMRPGRQRSLGCLAPGHRHRDRYPGPPVRIPPVPLAHRAPLPLPAKPPRERLHRLECRACSILQRSLSSCDRGRPRCSQTLAYWARQTRVWAGPESEAAAPRPRACAASRVPGEQAAAARRTGPPASASSLTPPNRLPISTTLRRTATASRHSPLPARPPHRRSSASGPPLPPRPQPTCPS